MSEVTLYGFPRSVYVQMVGIVLTHHEVAYAFHDLETEMNTPAHLALHPFERVPIRLARTHGKLADNEALSCGPAAARSHRTCAAMGGITPPEILKREPSA